MSHENKPIILPEQDPDRHRLLQTTAGLVLAIENHYVPLIGTEQEVPYAPDEEDLDKHERILIREHHHPLVQARIDRKLEEDFLIVHQNIMIDVFGEGYYREHLHSEEDLGELIELQQQPIHSTFSLFELPIDRPGVDANAQDMGLRTIGVTDLQDVLDNVYRVQRNFRLFQGQAYEY